MSIIDELILLLENRAKEISIPKIRRISIGILFVLIELENLICGLAFTKSKKQHLHLKDAGNLTSYSLLDLMKKAKLDGIEKSIGIAAINTLSQLFLSEKSRRTDLDVINFMELRPSDDFGMIGNMTPVVRKLYQKVNSLTVIENSLERQKVPEGVQIFQNYKQLKNVNKLIITGSAILHENFDEILNAYKNLEKVVIVGPTMGSLPEPFFNRGINAIGGMRILNPDKVQEIIIEGGGTQSFSKYCEKYLIINVQSQNSSPST